MSISISKQTSPIITPGEGVVQLETAQASGRNPLLILDIDAILRDNSVACRIGVVIDNGEVTVTDLDGNLSEDYIADLVESIGECAERRGVTDNFSLTRAFTPK